MTAVAPVEEGPSSNLPGSSSWEGTDNVTVPVIWTRVAIFPFPIRVRSYTVLPPGYANGIHKAHCPLSPTTYVQQHIVSARKASPFRRLHTADLQPSTMYCLHWANLIGNTELEKAARVYCSSLNSSIILSNLKRPQMVHSYPQNCSPWDSFPVPHEKC